MSAALIAGLVFTMVLLVMTAYVLMGSLPLLTLAHDTPQDARFVRGFFSKYYLAAMLAAGATAISYGVAGRLAFAAGATAVVVLTGILRRTVIPRMAALGADIQAKKTPAIAGFRRLHGIAIGVNLAQLIVIVWSLVSLSIQLR